MPNTCPINRHQGCKVIKQTKEEYINNKLDKKVKVVLVGSKGTGKTTLIHAMNQKQEHIPKHTISVDVVSIIRQVNNLTIQYNLWDTVCQSSII
jgi:GTPase SAR1 family protein